MKFSTILAIPLLSASLPAAAQAPQVQPLQMVPRPTPDADALGAAMRRIGANPRDLSSLIEAGELSLKLGDATAAASLFKRAEQIDPMNGRVKAGMARILVQQERPGEALRFFDQAAGYGLDARSFAGDRGLAYDLIGEQTRAQRDYVLALAAGPQEEVQRRYALSLAISGKQAEALKQIDPLVRQSDRGAWRTRAFILAMGGDLSGATDIATRMMPPGMATGLQPFFKTLPSLGPVDRAFAVHFGEIRATPARLADARLAPPLPALPPEPAAAPVTLAQAAVPVLRADLKRREARERRQNARDRRRLKQQSVQMASAAPPMAARPAATSLPEAPRYGSYNGVTFAAPREVAQAVPAQTTPAPVQPAVTTVQPAAAPVQVAAVATPTPRPATPTTPAPATRGSSESAQTAAVAAPPAASVPRVAVVPAPPPSLSTMPPPPNTVAATTATVAPTPGFSTAPTPMSPTRTAATTSAPVAPQMSEDSILARIIAGISIPAEELGVAPARPASTAVANAPAPGPVRQQPVASAPVQVASVAPAARPAAPIARSAPTPRPTTTPKPTVDPKIAARKAAADRKVAEAKKLADAEKAAAAKKLADEKKAAKADPARIWVQVAGGANASDLSKAWNAAQGKAAALKGKTAYSTPLRATNRVVTGPFKTNAEAQAMVNTLAKEGVSAFTFTSEVGQRVTRLSTK